MPLKNICRRIVRILASLQLTVIGLLFMALLVIGGTIIQAEKGVYAAQQNVFQAWIFWLFDVIPLPGMLLIGALLFINLLSAVFFRLQYKWSGLGMLLIHVGLLVLLGGGFISFQYARDYFMTLSEGESSQTAEAAHEWELAVWTQSGIKKQVLAVDITDLRLGKPWAIPTLDLELTMIRFFPNCRPSEVDEAGENILKEIQPAADPEENIPGAIFKISGLQSASRQFRLFSGYNSPVTQQYANRNYYFSLRLKRIILPLQLKLLDFKKTVYPGTEIPKSFSSRVEIESGGLRRETLISMNRPLRFHGYTFYQSSYAEDDQFGASSTFAVVKNAGRWLPYISSALVFLGLLLHFISQLAAALKKSPLEVKS
jgi:hypothetical protein